MGRFSPTVMPTPSWTNSMAQGAGDITQALIQRRQFDQQKLQQNRQFGLQQQEQDVRNAEAGYTPAGLSTATPQGMDAISNAGVSDASQPASYDPTKGLTYALMTNRNAAMMDRTQAQVAGRQDVADTRNRGQIAGIAARYGTYNPDGTTATMGAQTGSKLQSQAPVLQQRDTQFQQREGDRAASLAEQIRYHSGELARPVGTGRGGASATPTATSQMSAYNADVARYMKPHQEPVVDPKNPENSGIISRLVDGVSYDSASTLATKHAQDRMKLFGAGGSLAPAGHAQAPKASADVQTTVPPQGNVKMMGDKTDQHVITTSGTIPKNPTDSNTGAYDDEAKQYQAAATSIQGSSLSGKEKLSRLSTLRTRYNARVAALAAPQK